MGTKFINDFHYLCSAWAEYDKKKEKIDEMKELLKQAKSLRDNQGRPLLFGDLRDIFFTAGATYRTFIIDATYEEEVLYDTLCNFYL